MNIKLLKKIRNIGREEITVYSVTKTGVTVTGMSYGYTGECYSGLFSFGDTEDEVKEKACRIYLKNNIDQIRSKYKKYSRKYKNNR